jgi:hypothetical protein
MPFKSLSNKSFLRVFIITLSLFAGIAMQAQKLTDAEIKTALIYNFLKYTEHPDFSHKDTLYIGVYGDDATMISSLGRLEKQKIKGKRLKLVFLGEQIIVPGLDAYYLLNEYNFEQSRIFKELQEKAHFIYYRQGRGKTPGDDKLYSPREQHDTIRNKFKESQ